MANIRYLNVFDIFKLRKLISHLGSEKFSEYTFGFLFHPLAVINYIAPLKMKFLPDSYVSLQNGNLKGMISIKPKKNNPFKWRIKKLLLDENSYETGEQLINFVVNKYGAKGVETIEAEVNSSDTDMIDLFSKACGFRYCLDYVFYEIKDCYYKNRQISTETSIFRPFKKSDCNQISELYNQNISPYYKFPLSKTPKEFEESICKGMSKKSLMRFILEDKFTKQIRGYVQIETEDNKNFVVETVILPSFENYFEDMLTFAISQISKRVNKFKVYARINKFQSNSEGFEKTLSEIDNEIIQTNMIFVKDFFRQIKEEGKVVNPAMIYNEINGKPAFKI